MQSPHFNFTGPAADAIEIVNALATHLDQRLDAMQSHLDERFDNVEALTNGHEGRFVSRSTRWANSERRYACRSRRSTQMPHRKGTNGDAAEEEAAESSADQETAYENLHLHSLF